MLNNCNAYRFLLIFKENKDNNCDLFWKYEKLSAPENKEYVMIKKRISCVQRADFLGYSSTCDLENFVKTAKRKRLGEAVKKWDKKNGFNYRRQDEN